MAKKPENSTVVENFEPILRQADEMARLLALHASQLVIMKKSEVDRFESFVGTLSEVKISASQGHIHVRFKIDGYLDSINLTKYSRFSIEGITQVDT